MDLQKAIAALTGRGFAVRYFETAAEAAAAIDAAIDGRTVGFGGSVTLEQLGLFDRLGTHNTVFWHWRQSAAEARQASMTAQVYLLSANAIAETGQIVNIDGTGNRVSAALYGHERVMFVAGVNKLAPDLPAAIARAKNIAAPLNARRLGCKTPCALSEPMRCHDCASPTRICNVTAVIDRPPRSIQQMDIILIGEPLGY